ncbi:preprotein translocase subunit SecA [Rosistilla carotiformis]|uniref:Protein translocase subunit SecA n=1 Tax=Rosistilla carotiformis TaxID=2528017 RepID=A0A518K037_9BACT|nr:preprotein translocase subunit SecA [Rosistilla carotiformis]QDV71158.1 preprotein translocase subunit SecA [Rosistilla carotiformis]
MTLLRHHLQAPAALRNLPSQVAAIRDAQRAIRGCDPQTLRAHTSQLRTFVQQGATVASPKVLALGGAIVCEAVDQVLGKSLYDVQLIAGIILAHGAVAEMQTGEGKTLSGVMPAVLHALPGRGVHVATPNSYLAQRDFETLQPVIEHLGLTAGCLGDDAEHGERADAYQCDITYAPGYAFGFDYLRDQLALRSAAGSRLGDQLRQRLRGAAGETRLLQRERRCAILDEIDHVLIDDAISPLILSAAGDREAPDAAIHRAAKQIAATLVPATHFTIPEDRGGLELRPAGIDAIYRESTLANDPRLRRAWHEYVHLAIRATHQFQRDVHYIVSAGKIRIIDTSTGRIFDDRTWNDGQHQAIEAKEGLRITSEQTALARITRQRFFGMYEVLCGMTGTATGCADELQEFYRLSVVPVPLRVPSRRQTLPTIRCRTAEEKRQRIADEARQCQQRLQPVLIGTHSIADSQQLAERFEQQGLRFALLNGKQDADEAELIAAAGRAGAITIATNLAGRGTDIHLDPEAAAAGGLHVIVSQHHAIDRVDRQLVGRAARQGDPGSVRFYCAPDDPIFRQAPWIARWLERRLAPPRDDTPRSDSRLAQMIAKQQSINQRKQACQRRELFQRDLATQKLIVTPRTRNAQGIEK